MTDPTRPATGYPAGPPQNGYPQPPPSSNPYFYPNHNPYHAPPPPQYQPPRATLFRRLFAALIAAFIIFGTVMFIVWLVLRPKVPSFSATSLTVTSLNLSSPSATVSATFSAALSADNPNSKLSVLYDDVEARLFYRSSLLAQNQLPPFQQPTHNTTSVAFPLVASSSYIDPSLVADIKGDISRGSVKFNLQLLAIVRFKTGGWRARRRFLRVFCDDLAVAVAGNATHGSLSNGPKRCAVGI